MFFPALGGWTQVANVSRNAKSDTDLTLPNPLSDWVARREQYALSDTALAMLKKLINFTQIRFKCYVFSSGRNLDIATAENTTGYRVVNFFTNITNLGFPDACYSFTRLPDDNSKLSTECSNWGKDKGAYEVGKWGHETVLFENRLIIFPLFVLGKTHFHLPAYRHGGCTVPAIRQGDCSRWECDDSHLYTSNSQDYWKIFVR